MDHLFVFNSNFVNNLYSFTMFFRFFHKCHLSVRDYCRRKEELSVAGNIPFSNIPLLIQYMTRDLINAHSFDPRGPQATFRKPLILPSTISSIFANLMSQFFKGFKGALAKYIFNYRYFKTIISKSFCFCFSLPQVILIVVPKHRYCQEQE